MKRRNPKQLKPVYGSPCPQCGGTTIRQGYDEKCINPKCGVVQTGLKLKGLYEPIQGKLIK